MRTTNLNKRKELFAIAFCSLLKAKHGTEDSDYESWSTGVLNHLFTKVWASGKEKESLAVGLITKNPENTSSALKLLACRGLAAPVIKGV